MFASALTLALIDAIMAAIADDLAARNTVATVSRPRKTSHLSYQ